MRASKSTFRLSANSCYLSTSYLQHLPQTNHTYIHTYMVVQLFKRIMFTHHIFSALQLGILHIFSNSPFAFLWRFFFAVVPPAIHLVPHAMGPPNHNASLVVPVALLTMVNVWIAAPMATMPIKNVKNVWSVRRAVPHVAAMVFVWHAKKTGRAIKKENVLSRAVKIAKNVSMSIWIENCCIWMSVARPSTARE